ncbi:Hypothetical protein NTJ_01513 [Nesidiocoris tenuis]|uniref:Secreted protein n=1 Tax=Nesidiocoris tenuis TaxID=355587 RepID=A0ABN7A8R9_9HEMI|nr:Hypothetical protein NTJ_01513 [Nesidiocoris tenuis]
MYRGFVSFCPAVLRLILATLSGHRISSRNPSPPITCSNFLFLIAPISEVETSALTNPIRADRGLILDRPPPRSAIRTFSYTCILTPTTAQLRDSLLRGPNLNGGAPKTSNFLSTPLPPQTARSL